MLTIVLDQNVDGSNTHEQTVNIPTEFTVGGLAIASGALYLARETNNWLVQLTKASSSSLRTGTESLHQDRNRAHLEGGTYRRQSRPSDPVQEGPITLSKPTLRQ